MNFLKKIAVTAAPVAGIALLLASPSFAQHKSQLQSETAGPQTSGLVANVGSSMSSLTTSQSALTTGGTAGQTAAPQSSLKINGSGK